MTLALAVLHISWSWFGIKNNIIVSNKKEIICLGNPYISGDDVCLNYAISKKGKSLNNYKFLPCYSLDEFIDYFENNAKVIILDTIKNISSIQVLKGIDNLKINTNYSLHDFDICSYIKLQENLGIKKDITIIGVPEDINFKEIDKFFLNLE
jgi:Ni,Fe-hydrogenase maturation factor